LKNKTVVDVVGVIPVNEKNMQIILYGHTTDHQLINANKLKRLFHQNCFSSQINKLFPLDVVAVATAIEANQKQQTAQQPTLQVAVATLAALCGLLMTSFLIVSIIYFINRERKRCEKADIIALSKSELPLNIYLRNDSNNSLLSDNQLLEVHDKSPGVAVASLPLSNTFIPKQVPDVKIKDGVVNEACRSNEDTSVPDVISDISGRKRRAPLKPKRSDKTPKTQQTVL